MRFRGLIVVLLCVSVAGAATAKKKRFRGPDPFPDFNTNEVSKPLPPLDVQERMPKPGSIQLHVDMKPEPPGAPLSSLPIPIQRAAEPYTVYEPPLELDDVTSTATARSPGPEIR